MRIGVGWRSQAGHRLTDCSGHVPLEHEGEIMSATENCGRISNRIPQAIAQKLHEAAELTGMTLNQFMLQASLEKAESIIDREKTIHFSQNDAAMLIHLRDNPSKPNAALMRAFERFKQRETENGNQRPNAPP